MKDLQIMGEKLYSTFLSHRNWYESEPFMREPFVFVTVAALSVLLPACGVKTEKSSSFSDVATDLDNAAWTREKYLFFQEGSFISQAGCDPTSQLHDRANCKTDVHSVPGVFLQEELYKKFGANLDSIQRRLSDHLTAIERADFRLIELIQVRPDPIDSSLLPQISAKVSAVASVDVSIAEIKDQMERVKQLLRQSEDADLRLQLRLLETNQSNLLADRIELSRDLNLLRQRYISANSSIIDSTTYNLIIAQQKNHVTGFESARNDLAKETQDRILASRLLNYIADGGFTYEITSAISSDLRFVTSRLKDAFEAARVRYSEFSAVPVSHQQSLDLVVSRHGVLESFQCQISWNQSGCNKLRLTHTESGFVAELPSVDFEVSKNRITHSELSRWRGADPFGHWRIGAYCIQPNVRLTQNDCKIVLK